MIVRFLKRIWRGRSERMCRVETEFFVFECPQSMIGMWRSIHGEGSKITMID